MSRIGKKNIYIPDEVNTIINNNTITISGPKGTLFHKTSSLTKIILHNENHIKTIIVYPANNTKKARELHGLSRTLIYNMIIGVTQGFTRHLTVQGIGYRCQMNHQTLILSVGYSHNVIIKPPKNIFITVNNNDITVSGINKELVGQVAATIRAIRKPEPYKAKGIKYNNEVIQRKVGKAGK